MATEESVKIEKFVVIEKPGATEKPATIEEPVVMEKPVGREDTMVKEEHVVKEEIVATEKSVTADKTMATEKPVAKEAPAATEKPISEEEPSSGCSKATIMEAMGLVRVKIEPNTISGYIPTLPLPMPITTMPLTMPIPTMPLPMPITTMPLTMPMHTMPLPSPMPMDSIPGQVDMSHLSPAAPAGVSKFNKLKMQPALNGTNGGRVQKKPKKKKRNKHKFLQQQKNQIQRPQEKKEKRKRNKRQKQQNKLLFNQLGQSQQPFGKGWQTGMDPVQSLSVNQTSDMSALPFEPGRLMIKNLDINVTDQDIYILFSDCGEITDASVHYNRLGKSLGSAQVSYKRYIDAVKGQKKYQGMPLDGRPMIVDVEKISYLELQQSLPVITAAPARRRKKNMKRRLQRGSLAINNDSQYVRPLLNQQGDAMPLNFESDYSIDNQQSMGFANPGYGFDLQPVEKSENLISNISKYGGMSSLESTSVLSRVSPNINNRVTYSVMDRTDYGFNDEPPYAFSSNLGGIGHSAGNFDNGRNIGGQWFAGQSPVRGSQQKFGMQKQQPNQQRKKKRKKQQKQQVQGIQIQQGGAQKGTQKKKKKMQNQNARPLTAEQLN